MLALNEYITSFIIVYFMVGCEDLLDMPIFMCNRSAIILIGYNFVVNLITDTKRRQRLVILGTGWGSYSVLRSINKKLYDVIVVSPRDHFLFTPLLCSTTVGTLEFRSVIRQNIG